MPRDSNFTIPIDKNGLVIYFGINGKRFFFNGHKGTFYDSLHEYAEKAFNTLSKPKEDQVKIFESLKRNYGNEFENLSREIRSFQNGTYPDLEPEPRQKSFSQRMSPSVFNVYVSQGCNLSCRYCFNQGGTFGKSSSFMGDETAKDLLSFITKIVREERYPGISVNLYGGEPLLSTKAVYLLARGLQNLNHENLKTKIYLMLSTNGTIYNKKIFDVFAERPDLCVVAASLDGFKDIHDKNRPFRNLNMGSTYDTVLKNLKRMIREKIPYSVTCVVPYPYKYIASAEELHRLGVKHLEIKQLIQHIYGQSVLPEVFESEFQLWRKNYQAYSDYYIDYLHVKNSVQHDSRFTIFADYGRALGNKRNFNRTLGCGLADVKVGITADGRIMPCESFLGHKQFELGNVKNGFDQVKFDKFEEWILSKGQHRIDNKRCRNCYAKLICGGGCYAVSYDQTRNIRPWPESSCQFIRETVKIDLYYISRIRKEHPEIFSRITGVKN